MGLYPDEFTQFDSIRQQHNMMTANDSSSPDRQSDSDIIMLVSSSKDCVICVL